MAWVILVAAGSFAVFLKLSHGLTNPWPTAGFAASALISFGLHGSGFLAVSVAGVMIGDERAPYQREIARFHSALASLGEIVAFIMLGLTIRLHNLAHHWAWLAGLVLALLLSLVIRPLLVGVLLWPVRLRRRERLCVLWGGLKGAVPILLGAYIVQDGVSGAQRLYEIIFVVVAFSVIVQGGTMPWLLRRLQIPLRTIEPEPWSLGIRFTREPEGLHRFVVAPGAAADAIQVGDLPVSQDAWISLLIRDGGLVPVPAAGGRRGGGAVHRPGRGRADRAVHRARPGPAVHTIRTSVTPGLHNLAGIGEVEPGPELECRAQLSIGRCRHRYERCVGGVLEITVGL